MKDDVTTTKILRGLLSDSASLLLGWPKPRTAPHDGKKGELAGRVGAIRCQLAFLMSLGIGCVQCLAVNAFRGDA